MKDTSGRSKIIRCDDDKSVSKSRLRHALAKRWQLGHQGSVAVSLPGWRKMSVRPHEARRKRSA